MCMNLIKYAFDNFFRIRVCMPGVLVFCGPAGARDFFFSKTPRSAPGPTEPPILWVAMVLSLGVDEFVFEVPSIVVKIV